MYLKKTRQPNGRVSLGVVESFREDGKSRQRTVKSLGYLDELEQIHKDPIAWGKSIAEKMTREKKAAESSVDITIHPMQKIDKRTSLRKNIGCACALSVYEELGIPVPLRNRQSKSRLGYDLNAAMRLLVTERIIAPGSKRAAWKNRGHYFFKSDLSEDDIYRALDEIADAKDSVIGAMNRAIASAGIRDMSSVFYDVTNYYFEIDDEDELRRKGVSKEHRRSPIIQMGLLQDANGIPITYKTFPGNTSDSTTMIPVLASLKRDYGLDRVVCVADKGLNSSDNIVAAVASGDGFVFSQSVRGTKSDAALKAWVISEEGYAYKTEDNRRFKSKSMQGFKTIHLKAADTATGKAQDRDVEVKYVAFWSEKYEKRARHERAKAIEKARDLIAHPASYTRATSCGAAQYVRDLHFNKETGEIVDAHKLSLDEQAIAEAERYDGYYLIVTSETDWDDERIIDTYRELWRIEESFKVTKSELKTRPVYVWTPKHIEAHFLTCYVALVILRLLQLATGLAPSVIRREMAAMSGTNIDANWWAFDHRSEQSDLLVEACGLEELKRKNLQTKDIRSILAKAKRLGFQHKK